MELVEPKTAEEVSYRTETVTKNSTTTNKRTILSRTTNVNAVQVNNYDRDGTLKSKEMDSSSWEERDTHNYEWSGYVKPPEVDIAIREEEAKHIYKKDQCQRAITTTDDGNGITMLTSSDVSSLMPSIQWTGTVEEGEFKNDFEHTTSAKLEGSKWVHKEESVSMSMGKSGIPKPSTNIKVTEINGVLASDRMQPSENRGLVVVPAVTPPQQKQQQQVVAPELSPMERRQMRRSLNREMVAGRSQMAK